MFDKSEGERLRLWHDFRETLETADDPIQNTIDLYSKAPITSISTDPYDPETWMDPWELLNYNMYCDFGKILGIGYTLSLTDRFSSVPKMIHISTNKKVAETKYLLYIGDVVIGYHFDKCIHKNEIDREWIAERVIALPSYQ